MQSNSSALSPAFVFVLFFAARLKTAPEGTNRIL